MLAELTGLAFEGSMWPSCGQRFSSNLKNRQNISKLQTPFTRHLYTNMPKVVYSLDSAIAAFFSSSGTSATRELCDDLARRQFGDPVEPVQLQGMMSYTVRAGNKIVQFREQGNSLDEDMAGMAAMVHPDVVASFESHGLIGGSADEKALSVYSMHTLPGKNYIFIRESLAKDVQLQLATVKSLAKCVHYCSPPFYFMTLTELAGSSRSPG